MKILVCGLPGSGKTTLADQLVVSLKLKYADRMFARINADVLRKMLNDWDFSSAGRYRQMDRIKAIADNNSKYGVITICDFVCPTEHLRKEFAADFTIWIDTIEESQYKDTNALFELPAKYNVRVLTWETEYWLDRIIKELKI